MTSKHFLRILCLLIGVSLVGSRLPVNAQGKPFLKNATIYLARHAEKDTGNNPSLTSAGRSRSGYLMSAVEGKKLQKIFVSQFRRTQETADSLRLNLSVDTIHYNADASGDALMNMLEKHRIKNERILIIGHSNTIPILISRLGINKSVSLRDDEYDTLYLIKYVKGKPMLFRKKFGDPLVQMQNTGWEDVL